MSWISPTFGEGCLSTPPPKKRSKSTDTPEVDIPVVSTTETTSCNWLAQYKPKTVGDLAVNAKKVKEVEFWLEQSSKIKSSNKFLLIIGPSGSGKTTTLQTVSKGLGFKVLEWITPLDKPDEDLELPSRFEFSKGAAKQFEDYLFRSSRYGSCLSSAHTRKLVLVKDFPNAFLRSPTTFHDIMENFVDKCVNPVVFICTEDSHCRKLFPATLKEACHMSTISFNPIPDQRMLKLLKTIIQQETRLNKTLKILPDESLSAICAACQGDMRSAIAKLFFCSIKSNFNILPLKPKGKFKKPKSVDESSPSDKDNRLDFFHGVGRVLYPKKIETENNVKFVHSTETIVENFVSEPKSFINQLHENYPSKFGNIDDLKDAADRLCASDTLMARWQDRDVFNTYGLSVAAQGLMVCNRNPVKGKFEAFKKSQSSRVEIDSKAIELEGKALFSDMNILDYECLIDVLPFSRSLLPGLNQAQLEYVRKTCQFRLI